MSSVTVSLKGNPELKNNKAYKVSDIFNVAGELSDGTAAAGELIALSPVSDEDAAIVGGEITFKKTGTFDLGLKAAYFGLEADATVSVTVAQGTEQVLEVVNYDSSVDATKNSFWGRYQDGILTGQEYYYAFDYKYDDASAMKDFMVYSELVTTYEWVIKHTGTKLTSTEQADTPITLTENLSADTWHHFVIHYTATTVGVYIDGQLQNNGQYFTRTKRPNYKYEMLGWNGRVGTAMTGHAYYDNLVLIDGGTKTTYSMPVSYKHLDVYKRQDNDGANFNYHQQERYFSVPGFFLLVQRLVGAVHRSVERKGTKDEEQGRPQTGKPVGPAEKKLEEEGQQKRRDKRKVAGQVPACMIPAAEKTDGHEKQKKDKSLPAPAQEKANP